MTIFEILSEALPQAGLALEGDSIRVPPEALEAVCRLLISDERLRLDYLSNLTAVDYPPDAIEVVYHLYSMEGKGEAAVLKTRVDRNAPRLASVTPLWRSAEFQEREVYDLYGVVFEQHPDLRRILLWEGFEGFPMRKDYVIEDQDVDER